MNGILIMVGLAVFGVAMFGLGWSQHATYDVDETLCWCVPNED